MHATVVVLADGDVFDVVRAIVSNTSATVIRASTIAGIRVVREPAAVIIGDDVTDATVAKLARLMAPEDRHRLLVLRQGADVATDVAWTVLRRSELAHTLPRLVEEDEAIVVELLASVRPLNDPKRPGRFGCVVSIGSRFILVAMDDPPEDPAVAFVMPGTGRMVVSGSTRPVHGRVGLWRIEPGEEDVRAALLAFTLRRGDGHEGGPT